MEPVDGCAEGVGVDEDGEEDDGGTVSQTVQMADSLVHGLQQRWMRV